MQRDDSDASIQNPKIPHQTMNLYIPEECKSKIQILFKEIYLKKINVQQKHVKVKQFFHHLSKNLNLTSPRDFLKEYAKCVKHTESNFSLTIFDFFRSLSNEIYKTFKFRIEGGWGACVIERHFSFAVYTALTQSLFDQFISKKDVYPCTQRLQDAIINSSVIHWKNINMKGFDLRLKEHWLYFRPILYDILVQNPYSCVGLRQIQGCANPEYPSAGLLYSKYTSTALLYSMGISLNDFIQSFFSSHDLSYSNPTTNNSLTDLPSELITQIVYYLGNDKIQYRASLHTFRQVCRTFYNVIENDYTLRMNHRLHLISKDFIIARFDR